MSKHLTKRSIAINVSLRGERCGELCCAGTCI